MNKNIGTNWWQLSLIRLKIICSDSKFFRWLRKLLVFAKTPSNHANASNDCNVLIIIENMSYTYDTRIQNISKTLNQAGYHINVICPRYLGDPNKANVDEIDINFYYLPSFPNGFLGYLMEYAYSICIIFILSLVTYFRQRVDIFHICNPPDFFSPMGRFFQLFNSRIIYDKHDRVPELFQQRFGNNKPLLYSFLRKAEDLTEKNADHIITTNESVKRNVIARNKSAKEKVTVVRTGPDLQKFPNNNFSQLNHELIKVGYVGNMNPQDCID